jgi:hypothetical protein
MLPLAQHDNSNANCLIKQYIFSDVMLSQSKHLLSLKFKPYFKISFKNISV